MRNRVVHIVSDWPSISQTFVLDDIQVSQEVFENSYVFPLPFRGRSLFSKYRNFFDFVFAIPVSLKVFMERDFRNELKYLFARNKGIRWKLKSLYIVVSANIFTKVFEISVNQAQTVIHAHFLATGLDIAILAKKRFPQLRVIATGHGSDVFYQDANTISYYAQNIDSIVAASDAVRMSIFKKASNSNLVDLVTLRYCRVPDRIALPKNSVKRFEAEKLRILTVARFHPQKGIETALAVAIALRNLGVSFSWTFIGDGKLKNGLEKLALRNQMGSCVNFLGKQSRKVVQEYMNDSDLFVLPAIALRNASDGLPVVILEAMNLGAYVLTTDVGGISEAINSETGSLLKGTVDIFVEEILQINRNRDLATSKIDRATEWVQMNCLRNQSDPLLHLYSKFL